MQTNNIKKEHQTVTPQLKVRSGVHSGASIEACTNNVKYWQDEFKKWYYQSYQNGFYPPFTMSL